MINLQHIIDSGDTPALITEAQRLEKAEHLTAGPWTVSVEEYEEDSGSISIEEIGRSLHDTEWASPKEWERDMANAEFIAASRQLIPALVQRVRELGERVAVLETERDVLREHHEQALANLGQPDAASLPDECLAITERVQALEAQVQTCKRASKELIRQHTLRQQELASNVVFLRRRDE